MSSGVIFYFSPLFYFCVYSDGPPLLLLVLILAAVVLFVALLYCLVNRGLPTLFREGDQWMVV